MLLEGTFSFSYTIAGSNPFFYPWPIKCNLEWAKASVNPFKATATQTWISYRSKAFSSGAGWSTMHTLCCVFISILCLLIWTENTNLIQICIAWDTVLALVSHLLSVSISSWGRGGRGQRFGGEWCVVMPCGRWLRADGFGRVAGC